jgi:hypothetical protein
MKGRTSSALAFNNIEYKFCRKPTLSYQPLNKKARQVVSSWLPTREGQVQCGGRTCKINSEKSGIETGLSLSILAHPVN